MSNGINQFPIEKVMEILVFESKKWNSPVDTLVDLQKNNPFLVLITTIVSLRTKDEVTIKICENLYKNLSKPEDILKLSVDDVSKLIYPCGFYNNKAKQIHSICNSLILNYQSIVPNEINELIKFPGVGRKTANLVLAEGYSLPAMCVDVHVDRISNRFGYVRTKNPDQTEMRLRKKLPKQYWNRYNQLLVALGQSICRPVSPKCSECPLAGLCRRVGVKQHR
jgi:endonuclease-3